MIRFILVLALALLTSSAWGQTVTFPDSGTIINHLAKLTGTIPSATNLSTTDTTALGIAGAPDPLTRQVSIITSGIAFCAFDGAVTVDNYFGASTINPGQCHDVGIVATAQSLGQILGNGPANTYRVILSSSNSNSGGTFSSSTQTANYTVVAGDMGGGQVLGTCASPPCTLTLPAATSSIFAQKMTFTYTNNGTSTWNLTNSTGLTATMPGGASVPATLLPGTSLTFVANVDGTHLDVYPGPMVPGASTGVGWISFSTNSEYVPGFGTLGALSTTGAGQTGDKQYIYKVVAPNNATITALALYLVTQQTGGAARMCIYNDVGGRPGTLLADFGTLDLSSGQGAVIEAGGTTLAVWPGEILWVDAAIKGVNPQTTIIGLTGIVGTYPMTSAEIGSGNSPRGLISTAAYPSSACTNSAPSTITNINGSNVSVAPWIKIQ